jgi:hypothetical protein
VTSPLWDLVFRTWRAPERLRVPEKQAMVWLLDPVTNDVRAELQRDYVLATRGDKRNPEARARAVGRVSEAA